MLFRHLFFIFALIYRINGNCLMETGKETKDIDTLFVSMELTQLEPNNGQLDGLPSNPRQITDAKMELLKQKGSGRNSKL